MTRKGLPRAAAGFAAAGAAAAWAAEGSWASAQFDVIVKGGVLMIPIIGCSIIALGYVIERFIMMQPDKIVPLKFVLEVRQLVREGAFDKAIAVCKTNQNPASSVFGVALMLNERSRVTNEVIRDTVQDLGARELDDIAMRFRPLLFISNVAPLLGLLGTVFGIIKAFNVVASEAGLGRADLLAAGISEALITTAAGLLVAIPALGFYNYFKAKLDGKISERMEISLRAFLEDLFERRGER